MHQTGPDPAPLRRPMSYISCGIKGQIIQPVTHGVDVLLGQGAECPPRCPAARDPFAIVFLQAISEGRNQISPRSGPH